MADYINDVGGGAQAPREINVSGAPEQTALFIQNGERVFQPCVLDGVIWQTERQGAPGKLSFKVLKDEALQFEEGNLVKFTHNGNNVFLGYVFIKRRNKDNVISVIAYDQLRYLKNKDICQFTNVKASEIIQKLATAFGLKTGEIEDTGYVIAKYRGSNETLFDIIQFGLDHTLLYSKPDPETQLKKIYVLYDDFGKLCLKHIGSMQVDLLIDSETAEDFDYESSIDRDTYNKIKLYYDNKETEKRETYYAFDSDNIVRWGILQMTESINPKQTRSPVDKVNTLLALHNQARRSLRIRKAFGDDRVRAGSMVYVQLDLGDVKLGSAADETGKRIIVPMLVESAQHQYLDNQHTMDLMLRGNVIR